MRSNEEALFSLLNHSYQAKKTQLSSIRNYRDGSLSRGLPSRALEIPNGEEAGLLLLQKEGF